MTQTVSPELSLPTTTLVLDTELGTMVSPSVDAPVGAGALMASFSTQMKKADNAVAQAMLGESEKKTITDTIGATISFDNGATYRVDGNTSVGNNHQGAITQKMGSKSLALLLLMSQNEVTMENISDDMCASLVSGEVASMARVFGLDFDSEKFAQAELLMKKIELKTVGNINGRQQASKVVINPAFE